MAWVPAPEGRASRSAGGGPTEASACLVIVARQGTPPLGPNDPDSHSRRPFIGPITTVRIAGRSTCRQARPIYDNVDSGMPSRTNG